MSRQRPFGALSVVLFSSLMTFACSRPMTCALEGCKQDNGVVLADDLQAGESADATAQKDDLVQKVKDVFHRLGAAEALAALLQETVKLHDTRIKLLEDHAKAVDARLSDIDGMIEHHEEEIHAQGKALKDLEVSFTARLETLAADEKLARDEIQADLDKTEGELRTAIADLDADTKDAIEGILGEMDKQRINLENADKKVAEDAKTALANLQTVLQGKIDTLTGEDAKIRGEIADKIKKLDDKVADLDSKSTKEFKRLWTSLGLLQVQVILVAADNASDHKRIRDEMAKIKSDLNLEIGKLQAADKATADNILALQQKQDATQAQLTTLETNYKAFVVEQKATNTSISENFTTVTKSVTDLKIELEKQIATEAARITDVVNVLLPAIAGRVSELERLTGILQTDLDKLEERVDDVEGEFTSPQGLHAKLRAEYDQFVIDTNAELATLRTMVSAVGGCTITPLNGNKVTLTCGSQSVKLNTTN